MKSNHPYKQQIMRSLEAMRHPHIIAQQFEATHDDVYEICAEVFGVSLETVRKVYTSPMSLEAEQKIRELAESVNQGTLKQEMEYLLEKFHIKI